MITLASGPDGSYYPGAVYDLPVEEAKSLVVGGYAEPVKGSYETAAVETPETEMMESPIKKKRSVKKK